MNINHALLERAFSGILTNLKTQNLPERLKKRWMRALEKACTRLIEQPYFAWQPERLLIVSVPQKNESDSDCRFYEANEAACRRLDRTGSCQAFYEGFPCWHRAAFLLLKIYSGETQRSAEEKRGAETPGTSSPARTVNCG